MSPPDHTARRSARNGATKKGSGITKRKKSSDATTAPPPPPKVLVNGGAGDGQPNPSRRQFSANSQTTSPTTSVADNATSPGTMNHLLHPQQPPHGTPDSDVSQQLLIQAAVGEMHQQDVVNRQTWVQEDLLARCRNRANKVIWNLCKTPKFTAAGDTLTEQHIRLYLFQEMKIPEEEFEKQWPLFRTTMTEALRSKRATVVQDMKRKFMGKSPPYVLLLLILPDPNTLSPVSKLIST